MATSKMYRENSALALEFAFQRPAAELLAEARSKGVESELIALGSRLFDDMARLSRGALSEIRVPRRLPRQGEYGS